MKELSEDSPAQKVSKEELDNLMLAAQQMEQQATRYNQQIELLNGYYNEIHTAEQTLNDLKDAKKEQKVLVPIGAGNFVYASLEDGEKVVKQPKPSASQSSDEEEDYFGRQLTRIP